MKLRYFVLLAGLMVLNPLEAQMLEWALKDLKELQQNADAAFEVEDYKEARKLYYQLANLGNKYAQYKLSVIYQHGLEVKQSWPTAYAWAFAAAEHSQPSLVGHEQALWEAMPQDQHKKARKEADKFMKKYNDKHITKVLWQKARRSKMESIGRGTIPQSLVSVSAPCDVPGLDGGGGAAAAGAAQVAAAGAYSGTSGGCGGFSDRREDPETRMLRIEMIERVMRTKYEGGLVELGDFEVIDEEIPDEDEASNEESDEESDEGNE